MLKNNRTVIFIAVVMTDEPNMKTIKCSLKKILNTNCNYDYFLNCVNRANSITFICSNFIRSYVLNCFNKHKHLPELNYNFIRMAFKALSKPTRGPLPKGVQLETYNKLCEYYRDIFVKLTPNYNENTNVDIDESKFNSTNLSYIFNLAAKEMEISYKNNIRLNFFKYLNQFVNESFIETSITRLTHEEFKKLSDTEKYKYKLEMAEEKKKIKKLKTELHGVKQDLINNTLKAQEIYHKWINATRNIVLPSLMNNKISHTDDLDIDPHKYLGHMLIMNKILEAKNKKLFQPISLRTSVTDKYISLDSCVIKDIFTEIGTNITNDKLWKKYFNISPKKYKIANYSFNHMISTDGLTVSLNFIKNDKIEGKQQQICARAQASYATKKNRKDKTEKEIAELKIIQEQKKQKKVLENRLKLKELQKQKRAEFKKLSVEDKESIMLKMKLAKNKFTYIEDAVKNEAKRKTLLVALDSGKIKLGDPGIKSPLTLLGKGKKTRHLGKKRKDLILFSYTNSKRLHETKRLIINRQIDNKKKKVALGEKTVKELEAELSKCNSRTTNMKNFNEYVKLKLKMRKLVEDERCYNNFIKKTRLNAYKYKRSHEDKLLNEIEEVYGKDSIFVIGDWSNNGKLKCISTPNLRMKKLLSKRFEVLLVDEYRTSMLYHENETKGENLKVKKTYDVMIDNKVAEKTVNEPVHAILTFKMGSNRSACINRDYNATLNMKKIVESLINGKGRPENFKRTH